MKTARQVELEAAYETPVERYAREGVLMSGCLWGSSYQKVLGKKSRLAKDEAGNPILLIKCGKLCDPGQKYCPRHALMETLRQEKSG
jgi:hypothetical protein